MSRETKTTFKALAIALLLMVGFFASPSIFIAWQRHDLLQGAKVGRTRAQVVRHLGEPGRVAHSRSDMPEPGTWKPMPTDPVEKEVLEYCRLPFMLFVYIGKDGRVTKVFLART